jgi:hypothetical protein
LPHFDFTFVDLLVRQLQIFVGVKHASRPDHQNQGENSL